MVWLSAQSTVLSACVHPFIDDGRCGGCHEAFFFSRSCATPLQARNDRYNYEMSVAAAALRRDAEGSPAGGGVLLSPSASSNQEEEGAQCQCVSLLFQFGCVVAAM